MSLFNKIMIVFSLLLFIALCEAPFAISARNLHVGKDFGIPLVKTHVVVYNFLEELNFTIHCKSKDDDLGTHVVEPEDNYDWEFRVNLFETTLFFCSVKWHDGYGTFDLYVAKRDLARCAVDCVWHVTKDGLYGYDRLHTPDLVYKWSRPPCCKPLPPH
ncbi:Self-incompatibility protein [Melia azedarach]|uniref:Self-incompatibility protein n=1 Tax=Melia azedarach TaxID=155640 RepID=A0ACC1YGE0_MELAZ|nr:Self-incompatibility protein [Melia azedarach]